MGRCPPSHAQTDRNSEDETRQAVPTLSTSRPINVREQNLRLVNTSKDGVKRALLVGIHYQDEEDESTWLASCHTDVRRIRQHLIHEEGFEKRNILVMMDDDRHHEPLKGSILGALERMCQISEPGDSIFFLFSGHGGTMINQDEYDEDGITHELLAPGNYRDNGVGVLMDDELYASFVTKVPEGVHAVAVIDTCHPPSYQSGKTSAIDLPYVCDTGYDEMRASEGYRPGRMLLGAGVVAGAVAGAAAVGSKAKKKKKPKKKKHEEEDEEMNDPSNYDDSYEEKKTKSRRKSKSKKNKPEVEREEEEDIEDNYEERPEKLERQQSRRKSKHKKKKKEEAPRNEEEYLEERQEEEKAKKKKKKPKKKFFERKGKSSD